MCDSDGHFLAGDTLFRCLLGSDLLAESTYWMLAMCTLSRYCNFLFIFGSSLMCSGLFLFAALPALTRVNLTRGKTLSKCFIHLQAHPRLGDYKQDWSFSLNEND